MANAAMRSGAGVVKLAVPDVLWPVVAPAVLESTVFPLADDGNEIIFDEKQFAELTGNMIRVDDGEAGMMVLFAERIGEEPYR